MGRDRHDPAVGRRQVGLLSGSTEHRRGLPQDAGHTAQGDQRCYIVGRPRARDTEEPGVRGGQEGPHAEERRVAQGVVFGPLLPGGNTAISFRGVMIPALDPDPDFQLFGEKVNRNTSHLF